MQKILLFVVTSVLLVAVSCDEEIPQVGFKQSSYVIGEELLFDDFSSNSQFWLAEGTEPKFINGILELDSQTGTTFWLTPSLQGNVLIEYDVTIQQSNQADVSQTRLGCFLMATEPKDAKNIFDKSEQRAGNIENYTDLNLYYIGLDCDESSIELSKYNNGGCEMLAQCKDASLNIKPEEEYHIQLLFFGDAIECCCNEKTLFCYQDSEPYTQGNFALNAKGHIFIDNFKITHLRQPESL